MHIRLYNEAVDQVNCGEVLHKRQQLGTEYEFHDTGLRLWREMAFHEKLLLDGAYMDEMRPVIGDMEQYRYFDMVTMRQ